jgi:hypothetical protein
MKTIKSIQWRAKRDALTRVLSDFTHSINDDIENLTLWIEDEENCATTEHSGLPNGITD